jgi:c-di-GMP-binding flagellar brake protein YcgR
MISNESCKINPMDRRVAPRYTSVFPVGMEFGRDIFCQSRALNISTTGMRVVVDQAIGKGVSISLTLCLDEDNLVELSGQTVWQESLGSLGTHVVGVAFNRTETRPRRQIKRWLREKGVAA